MLLSFTCDVGFNMSYHQLLFLSFFWFSKRLVDVAHSSVLGCLSEVQCASPLSKPCIAPELSVPFVRGKAVLSKALLSAKTSNLVMRCRHSHVAGTAPYLPS